MPDRPRLLALIVAALMCAASCAPTGGPGTTPTGDPAAAPTGAPSPAATVTPAAASPTPPAGGAGELVLMTHDSFAVSEEVLAEFEAEHGAVVRVLNAGDAGSMVNQAILAREAPLADVLYGVDNSFLSRALDAGLFIPYEPPSAGVVAPELVLDDEWRVTPIDYGDVCINYDREAFGDQLTPPSSLADLADPAYRGMLVVQNPATSSPGLAFLLATVAHFGEEGDYTWRDYWADLRANEVFVSAGWEDAYYGRFSGGAGEGDRPIVVSYATSPVAEVVFADPQPAEPPTGVVEDGCFRQIEFAGILAGTDAEPLARAFIDFMLSRRFQEDIPLNMFVFPASTEAELPEAFVEHAAAIDAPLALEPATIDAGRERWIEEWTNVVLR